VYRRGGERCAEHGGAGGLRRWWGAGVFVIYVLFLIVSGIAMLIMASAMRGQTAGRRAWYAVFGAGFTLYGLYLLLFFRGGHYLVFFYVFILPVLMTVRFFRDRSAFQAKQQAAALQAPPPGYAQPPGGGGIQDGAATAAQAAGRAPGGPPTPTGPRDAGSGPQLTVGDTGAPSWAAGTPLPAEMTGGFPLPADVRSAEPSPRHCRTAVLAAAAVSVVAAAAVTAIVLGKTSAHNPAVTPAPTPAMARKSAPERMPAPAAQPLLIGQLQPGDCLQGPPDINTARWWPYVVMAVPCTEKHIAEVYFSSANYWPGAMAFPGHASIAYRAKTECSKEFRAYNGVPSSASVYSFRDIFPWDRVNWSFGDRGLLCTAYVRATQYPRGQPLYGSMKGIDG
jgi:hypothetical protein